MGRRKGKTGKQKRRRVKTSIKDLPIDISLNILQRLPITSFLSVKLVCKDFYRLASHPELIRHYHLLEENPYGLIIRFWSPYITEPSYTNQLYLVGARRVFKKIIQPRMKKQYNLGPVLSCNGLLCLLFYKHKPQGFDYYRACLLNPLTGEHDFLPDLGLPGVQESSHYGTTVSFNQFFGFGFDVRTEEYKLLRIVKGLQADVFTLGKNDCRISQIDTPFVCPDQSSDVVVGGAIHWLCEDETWFHPKSGSRIILSFDLFAEKFHQMARPSFFIGEFFKISVLGGCLAITGDFSVYPETHTVHIWLLKEYGVKESWTKQFVIGESSRRLYPLFLSNRGNVVMSDELKALCCDPVKDHCEGYAKLIVVTCHVPSLVSPFDL